MDEGRGFAGVLISTLSTAAVMDQTTQFHYGKLVHPRTPLTVAPPAKRHWIPFLNARSASKTSNRICVVWLRSCRARIAVQIRRRWHFYGGYEYANSGEIFNIVSTSDINGDGATISDRPIGIKRNSGTTPPQFNVDLRYSRFIDLSERYKLEVFGEFQNLSNINSIVQFTNVTVTTNASTGELIGGLPDFKARNQSTSQDSRQFQLGLKFLF